MPINREDNKALLEGLASLSIRTEEEKNVICFRFRDLNDSARERFIRCLIDDSSIATLRQAKESDVKEVLEIANPIIIRGGRTWSGSSLFRWGERQISRIVYYTLFRRLAQNPQWLSYIKRIIRTPMSYSHRDYCGICGNVMPTMGQHQYIRVGLGEWQMICEDCNHHRTLQ